ncbi:hypothetical protein ACLB2K_000157 [Fragaria x ananassa]
MAEVFGVVAGAVGLAFQIAKLIAGANRLYHKYKELEPNVSKLNSTLVSLKAIVARLDTHTPLLPGEFVNGVPTELINGLKEDIDRATQVVDRINNSSGFAPKFRKTIQKYSEEIDKVSSDFKVSLLVLIAFQVRDIKDDTSHIRALVTKETTEKGDTTTAVLNVNTSHTNEINEIIEEDTTTDKKIDKKMSLQLDQIYEDVSRLSSCSKTARLLTWVSVKEDLEKDITSNLNRMSSLCVMTRSLYPDVKPLLDDLELELTLEIFPSGLRDLPKLSINELLILDETIQQGIALVEEISVVRAQKGPRPVLDTIKAYCKARISRLKDFLRKFRVKCGGSIVAGGKYGGTGGTRSDILTNLTGLFPDSLKKMEIRLKNLLKIHGLSRESDGIETEHKATEEEVTVTEEDDGETTCGACRKCYGFAEYRIQCNTCEKWFHGMCVLITPDTAEEHFRCRACSH